MASEVRKRAFALRFAFFVSFFSTLVSNRVLELSDKFLDVYKSEGKQWLVMMYAPWCHHCQQLEAAYAQVAQDVHNEDIGVLVTRVDCTRFTAVATHFNVKGFPTIIFISGDKVVEFNGDRTKEEIVDFARRMSGNAIKILHQCDDVEERRERHSICFVSFGESIWNNYSVVANSMVVTNWFYHIPVKCPEYDLAIYALKSSNVTSKKSFKYANDSTSSLHEWVKRQRFPLFVKLTPGNFNLLLNTGKLLVIGLVEEHRIVNKLTSMKHEEFRDMLEAIAHTYDSEDQVIFAWTSHLEMINSIAMHTIAPLPNLIVLNSTTLQYYLMEEEMLPQNIIALLDNVKYDSTNLVRFGGDSFYYRIFRIIYEGFSTLSMMYKGNPVLTLVVFGLPLSFLSIIVYTSCCSDFLDSNEDEEETHDKKD